MLVRVVVLKLLWLVLAHGRGGGVRASGQEQIIMSLLIWH